MMNSAIVLGLLDKASSGEGFDAFNDAQNIFDNMGKVVFSFINLLQRNIYIPILLIVAICAVAIIGGKKGVEFAKSKIFYVIMAVLILINVVLIVTSMIDMFGGDTSNLSSMANDAQSHFNGQSPG